MSTAVFDIVTSILNDCTDGDKMEIDDGHPQKAEEV